MKNPLAVIQLGVDYLTSTNKESANRDTIETIQEMADAVQRARHGHQGIVKFFPVGKTGAGHDGFESGHRRVIVAGQA
ncbi:MAG: hypothetical protein WDN00_07100 [Limisphaerales bacterium]